MRETVATRESGKRDREREVEDALIREIQDTLGGNGEGVAKRVDLTGKAPLRKRKNEEK